MTYDPRVSPQIRPFVLFPKQEELVNWLYDNWDGRSDGLVEKTRDCGATWVSAAFAVWLWLFHDNQAIGFGSRKQDLVDKLADPKCIFEKIRMLIEYLPNMFKPEGYNPKQHDNFLRIINPANGSSITGEAGDDIGRGGRTSIYFKDESAFYERPEKIEAALSQNSDCKIDISTPNGNGNPFYKKRHGGNIPVFTFHWRDDPRKDQAWYDKQVRELDPVIVAQEVDIDYNASVANALIDARFVEKATSTRPTDLGNNNDHLIVGVDVARFGDDSSAICVRQGRVVVYVERIQDNTLTELTGRIVWLMENNPRGIAAVCIDIGGMGAGVFDQLNERYDNIYGINFGSKSSSNKYFNKRSEMWGEMKEWLASEAVSIPNDQHLMGDLCSLQYTFNSDGKLVLEKKDDAKKRGVKSPDVADAMALTFAVPNSAFEQYYDDYDNRHDGRDDLTGY